MTRSATVTTRSAKTGQITSVSSSTSAQIEIGTGTSTNSPEVTALESSVSPTVVIKTRNLEKAVYAQIQAIRALGRTTVNVVEIANALGVSIEEVNQVVDALRRKGVRRVNP